MMVVSPCGTMLESRGSVSPGQAKAARLLPCVQPCCLVPVCMCLHILLGKLACVPLEEGMFRSAIFCELVPRLL